MQYGTQIGSLLTRAETQRLVVDLYKQGMPIKEIAAQVPVCLATVYRWINLPKHKNVKQKAEPKTEDSSAGGDSKKSVNTDNINSETALLEAQIKELKAQLRAAEALMKLWLMSLKRSSASPYEKNMAPNNRCPA